MLLDTIKLPLIQLNAVSVDYPILGQSERMLRHKMLQTVLGGAINNKGRVSVHALHDISMSVFPGDAIGLIGPNGSGKSTLLRVISGVLKPSDGQIQINARITSLLTINAGMLDEATGLENIRLHAVIKQVPRLKRKEFMEHVRDLSELGDYLNLPLRTYSSGMRLRLAFAIAILIDIDVIVMDEIIGVADQQFQEHIVRCIQELTHINKALVVASHSSSVITKLCTRTIRLQNGRMVNQAEPLPETSN